MSLLLLQMEFSESLALLIQQVPKFGFDGVTMGECWRPLAECQADAAAGTGIVNSLHGQRLAADLNFFIKGVYISDSARLSEVGAWWKEQISAIPGAAYKWGGDIKSRPDGNHLSLSPDART
jgi:hypothetical protein